MSSAWTAILTASSQLSQIRGVASTKSETPMLAMARQTEPTLPLYRVPTKTIRMFANTLLMDLTYLA
jgi:hypothetical protein